MLIMYLIKELPISKNYKKEEQILSKTLCKIRFRAQAVVCPLIGSLLSPQLSLNGCEIARLSLSPGVRDQLLATRSIKNDHGISNQTATG